jgi:fatty acid amide hydrolase
VTELIWQSATTLARWIAARDVSSTEVVAAHIARIEAVNPRLNAVVVPLFEQARQEAKRADQRVASGDLLGPLHGVPVTVKECYHLAGTASSIGVSLFQSEVLDADGPLIQRLRSAGAVILGKTNVPQAMLLHETDNPIYGRSNNPWDLSRSPGGSSGGEAAIIAAGGSPLGIANDLGGSIRQPAHVCGLMGIKPTAGRFTNTGCRNNLSGLRLIATLTGAIARTTEDLHLALRVLQPSGSVVRCEDEIEMPWRDPSAVNVAALRVGYFEDDGYFRPSPAVRRAVRETAEVLRNEGAQVVEFRPPDVSAAISLYFSLIGADGARAISQFLEGDTIDWRIAKLVKIGRIEHPWREIMAAAASAAKQPRTAQLLRSTGKKTPEQLARLAEKISDYVAKFEASLSQAGVDVLIFPPHGLPAPLHGSTFHLPSAASYCFIPNLLGIPAGVVPCTRVKTGEESDRRPGIDWVERTARKVERGSVGLPIGVQVAARAWREDLVLAVMTRLEQAFRGREDYPLVPPFKA